MTDHLSRAVIAGAWRGVSLSRGERRACAGAKPDIQASEYWRRKAT